MKSGTPSHPKVRRLARRLGIPRAHAVGLLCWLWDSAERLCPAGDIGRLEDADIAEEVMWEGDPAALVSALVTEQLFDANDTHRLVIHDWAEHCSQFVHRRVARSGKLFADGSPPNIGYLTAAEREAYQKLHPELQQTQPLTGVQPPNNRRITAE